MHFGCESVIKSLSINDIMSFRASNNKINRAINKFEIKMARIPYTPPLDYIRVLPKRVLTTLIEQTREKMLFSKQDLLMHELQKEKAEYKKY